MQHSPKCTCFPEVPSPKKEQSWADSSLQYFLDSRVPSIVRGHINLIAPFPEEKKTCHGKYTQDIGRSTLTSETTEFGTFFRDTPHSAPASPRQAHTLLYVTLWEGPHSDPRQSTQNQLLEQILLMPLQKVNWWWNDRLDGNWVLASGREVKIKESQNHLWKPFHS